MNILGGVNIIGGLSLISVVSSSGGFSPTSLTGTFLWLDGNDSSQIYTDSSLTTNVSVDGDVINGWKDKSGLGNHFITTSTAAQGIFRTGANGKNSNSVVEFNGTATQLQKTLASLTTHTFFCVFTDVNTSGAGYGTLLIGNAGQHGFQISRQVTSLYRPLYYGGAEHSGTFVSAGSWTLGTWDLSGTGTFNSWQNGSQYNTNATGADSSVVYDRIGGHGSEFLQGKIAEMIIYNRVLNSTERGQIESYLQTKWGGIP